MKTWRKMNLYGIFACTDYRRICSAEVKPADGLCEIKIHGTICGASVVIIDALDGGSAHRGKIRARRLMAKIEWDKRG